jgi:hypothetical protein
MGFYEAVGLDDLIGKSIARIRWSEDHLVFNTSDGAQFAFGVAGDCCSSSYFHDFYGVAHLLNNGPVLSVRAIDLPEFEQDYEHIQCYGHELVTKHPIWGEVTSVFSFRNSSNGYYGGWMYKVDSFPQELPEITCDQVGA